MARRFVMRTCIVTCDFCRSSTEGLAKWCGNDFRTSSVRRMIPQQLAEAGWTIRTINHPTRGRMTQEFCPEHRPASIMEKASASSGAGGGGAGPPASRFL